MYNVHTVQYTRILSSLFKASLLYGEGKMGLEEMCVNEQIRC
jgi:hypothetical protein